MEIIRKAALNDFSSGSDMAINNSNNREKNSYMKNAGFQNTISTSSSNNSKSKVVGLLRINSFEDVAFYNNNIDMN